MKLFKILLDTSRPISWVNTAYPFALMYFMMSGKIDTTFLIGTFFFLVPYNLLMYGVNDIEDYESDIRNPRKGGVEGAVTPRKYHRPIAIACLISVVPFFMYLISLGSVLSKITLGVVLFFVLAYSLKGLRFKEIPLLDSMTSSMHFVGPMLYAMTLVGANQATLIAAGAFFLWGMASQAFGAVQDIIPDREANIRSIATELGGSWTVRFAIVCYVLASITVLFIGPFAYPVALAGLLYVASIWHYRSIDDARSSDARAGWKRFLYLNYITGAVVTICSVAAYIWA